MILSFTFILSLFSVYAQDSSLSLSSGSPGRAIIWSPSSTTSSSSHPTYKTQSVTMSEVQKMIKEQETNKEILVMFCSDSKDEKVSNNFYSSSIFSAEITTSGESTILPNLYQAASDMKTSVCSQLADSATKVVTPEEITQLISNSDILSNGKLESYLVQIPSGIESEMSSYKSLFSKLNSAKALFVALQNPSQPMPIRGNYHRLLSSDIEDGVNYLPEGSEFSIYYQAQYLYLTPDIFTGIMTGLFMAIVLLIGFNCMGAIQGNSTYPSVLPPLGKEG